MSSPIIEVENLSFKYSTRDNFTLENINFKINKGEFIGIVGKSGSGKSTLLHCLTGIIPNEISGEKTGSVKINNLDTDKHETGDITRELGIVFQNPESQLFNVTVEDEVAFMCENLAFPKNKIKESVDFALDTIGIRDLKDAYPFELSGGEKQKVAIASVLSVKPKILVLDEPSSELDANGRKMVFDTLEKLKNDGMTIILVEHNLDDSYKLLDRLAVLDNGKIKMFEKIENVFKSNIFELLGLRPPQIVQLASNLESNKILIDNNEIIDLLDEKLSSNQNFLKYKNFIHKSSGEYAIEIENLSFKREDKEVLKNINLKIKKGEIVSLIGKNGSGKTTLALLIMGLLKENSGNIRIFGKETNGSTKKIKKKIGFLFQNPEYQLFCNTVSEEIKYGINTDIDSEKILKRMNLIDFKDKHPLTLSRGERQRVATATVLSIDPDILIIDEPTTGQDWTNIKSFMDILTELNNEGKTIFIISHDMRIVGEYCQRVILMDDGEILFNLDTREAFERLSTFEDYGIKPPIITPISLKAGIKPPLININELI